jgi:predicted RNA-binding protein YlxR (DUF448 family)
VELITESDLSDRTCVGCRKPDAREALLRFVLGEASRLVPDVGRKLPGRGASVHPTRACLDAAAKRGGFARAFSRALDVDARVLARDAAEQYRRRADGLLLAAVRSGHAAVGTDAVRAAIADRTATQPRLLVVAADAEGRREELARGIARLGGACVSHRDRGSLGRLFGRDELAVLAITDGGLAAEIGRAATSANELSEDE